MYLYIHTSPGVDDLGFFLLDGASSQTRRNWSWFIIPVLIMCEEGFVSIDFFFWFFYCDLSVLSEFGTPGNAAAALEIGRFLRRRRRLAEALLRLVMTQDLQWFLAAIVVLRLPCWLQAWEDKVAYETPMPTGCLQFYSSSSSSSCLFFSPR